MGRSTNIYRSQFNHAAPNTNLYVFISDLKSGIVKLACSNVAARKQFSLWENIIGRQQGCSNGISVHCAHKMLVVLSG